MEIISNNDNKYFIIGYHMKGNRYKITIVQNTPPTKAPYYKIPLQENIPSAAKIVP